NGRYKNGKRQHIVHCLFHENEGLLKCSVTNEAVEYTQRILRQHVQDSAATVPPESSSAACAGIEGGGTGTQEHPTGDEGFVMESAATVPPESSSAACADIEGGGTGTQEHPTGDEGFVMVSVATVPPESSSAACAGVEGGGTGTQEHPTGDEGFVMESAATVPPESSSAACADIEGGCTGTQEHPTGDEGFAMVSVATVPPESSSAACAGIEGGGTGTQEHPTGDEGFVMESAATVPPESSSAACAGIEGGGTGTQEHPTGDEGFVMESVATVPPESSSAACAGIEGEGTGTQEHPTGDKEFAMTQLTEVKGVEECDVIVAFCPISTGVKYNIEKAIQEIPDNKPTVLVAMHHTRNPEFFVPENGRYKNGPKMLWIHYLEAGNTLGSSKTLRDRIWPFWSEEQTVDDCKVVLLFCSVTSRAGTDINAALQRIPDNKDYILVAMHHTFERDYTVPKTEPHPSGGCLLAVDCFFHESEGGLLKECPTNDEAVKKIQASLGQRSKILRILIWMAENIWRPSKFSLCIYALHTYCKTHF
ncbi:hypothetical protein JZ751_005127, partial [Albula glossodonta]